jgi:hypothetical protein
MPDIKNLSTQPGIDPGWLQILATLRPYHYTILPTLALTPFIYLFKIGQKLPKGRKG